MVGVERLILHHPPRGLYLPRGSGTSEKRGRTCWRQLFSIQHQSGAASQLLVYPSRARQTRTIYYWAPSAGFGLRATFNSVVVD